MTYFISENELKSRTVLPSNISIELLRPWFIPSQIEYIKPIIGEALYSELVTAITNDSLTANQIILMGYIKDALAYYIQYKAYPFIHTQSSNKGVLVKSTENGSGVDLNALNLLTKQILQTADTFSNVLRCYLEDNKSLFPLYRSCYTSNTFFSGIQFGGINKNHCNRCGFDYCICR